MQRRVGIKRHGADPYFFTNLLELLLSLMLLAFAPLGKIEMPAAFIYVVNDKPRHR